MMQKSEIKGRLDGLNAVQLLHSKNVESINKVVNHVIMDLYASREKGDEHSEAVCIALVDMLNSINVKMSRNVSSTYNEILSNEDKGND